MIVTNVPVYYRLDLFACLEEYAEASTAYYAADSRQAAAAQVERSGWRDGMFALPTWPVGRGGTHVYVPAPSCLRKVLAVPSDYVLLGDASPVTAAIAARLRLSPRTGPRTFLWTGLDGRQKRWSLRPYYRWVYGLVDGVFTYNGSARNWVAEHGVPPRRIWNIGNNTLNADRYRGDVEAGRRKRPPADRVRVLIVGSLVERKNPLGALAAVAAAGVAEEVDVVFVGEGPLEGIVRERARSLGIPITVRKGLRWKDMPEVYASADLVVHLATEDWWPQVVNEAMAAGLPVIVSEQAGVDDWFFPDGLCGFRVDARDTARAGELVRMLVRDRELRGRLGDAAYLRARSYDARFVAREMWRRMTSSGHPAPAEAAARSAGVQE